MKKAYFADKEWLSEEQWAIVEQEFAQSGVELVGKEWKTEEEIIREGKDAHAILVIALPITRRVMDELPDLEVIVRCGIGLDCVDLPAATEKGIIVCNVPDYCVDEVSNHALALLLNFNRQIKGFAKRAKEGGYGPGNEIVIERLEGKNLGILGYGRIGRSLARKASALGLNIAVYDPFVQSIAEENVQLHSSLPEFLSDCDYVSIHTPLTPDTFHLFSYEEFAQMKKSAVLINVSRGAIVDKDALYDALTTGKIAGAGLDVCEGEPVDRDEPLIHLENVIYTPHVAMFSRESLETMYRQVSAQAIQALGGVWPNNVVNQKLKDTWLQKEK
ncbi:C-terminal binding protein [Brevibacillus panacihumi]|nr:C-terminal binding protein [Brevibacillus panacihumi]